MTNAIAQAVAGFSDAQVVHALREIAPDVDLFSDAQLRKALRLISADAVRPTEFGREFICIGSDGDHYLTARDACQCRGSRRGGGIAPCYHQAAVRLVEAAEGIAA